MSLNAALIAIASLNLAAQGQKITTSRTSIKVEPAKGPDPHLTKIYTNLGSKADSYDDGLAYQVTGPANPLLG